MIPTIFFLLMRLSKVTNIPPIGSNFMITEDGDSMITEDGDFMITE